MFGAESVATGVPSTPSKVRGHRSWFLLVSTVGLRVIQMFITEQLITGSNKSQQIIEDICKHYMTKAMEEIKKVKSELKGDIKYVNTRVNKLTEDVTDLKRLKDDISTIKDLREDMASLKETPGEPNINSSDVQELRKQLSMMESELERNKEETWREITQRDIRKTNIIAFNVPESKSDDPDNRKQHDQERFLQLCRELKLDDVKVVAVTRL